MQGLIVILWQTESLTASFSEAETRKKPGSHPHRLGMWGECILVCAWLLCAQMPICVWIVPQLVGLVNESSGTSSWGLRARERGSVSDFRSDLLQESSFFCLIWLNFFFCQTPFPSKMLWNFLPVPASQSFLAVAFHRYFSAYIR